jgi:hypothetical protein
LGTLRGGQGQCARADGPTAPAAGLGVAASVAPTAFRARDAVTLTVTVADAAPGPRTIVTRP